MRQVHRHPAGFTLLETLIVVGLVALLSVGIAGIFNTVGETISRGKRVSELNRTASQIERIMRRDFEQMTRDGFLLIRNEYALDGSVIPLFDPSLSDQAPQERARRIDEIMFFARSETGEFQTARRAMSPDMIARSSEARIYYGHGLRQIRPVASGNTATIRNDQFYRPILYDPNFDRNASFGVQTVGNPNQYAGDWALLRSAAVLARPGRETVAEIPADMAEFVFNAGLDPALIRDNEVQIGMQPAAKSIFRKLAREVPRVPAVLGNSVGYRVDSRQTPPWLSSGVVDIVTTNLDEVRAVVNHFDVDPDNFRPRIDSFDELFESRAISDRYLMQAWMHEGLPGNPRVEGPGSINRTRMRFEYEPPLLTITDRDLQVSSGNPKHQELERAYRQADQEMLPASVFVAGCSEFIVEWTYGLVDDDPASPTYGQLIWYGLPRYADIDGSGTFNNNDRIIAEPFRGVNAGLVLPRLLNEGDYSDYWSPPGREWYYPSRQLINANLPAANMNDPPSTGATEVSFFGFTDPGPLTPTDDVDDESWSHDSFNGDPIDNPSDDRPWLWPSMIRITMTLADRDDPTNERTYQAVFGVPEGGLDNK